MAVRRSPMERENEGGYEDDARPGFPHGGGTDEFGNLLPDFSNDPNYPVPFRDYQPIEIGGNETSARELFNRPTPTTPLARPHAEAPSQDVGGGLPHGMTVQGDAMGYGGDDMGGGDQPAFSTPAMPHEPSPISAMRPNPEVTRRVSSPGAQSALFSDDSGGGQMFGRAGGLLGGGKGVLGANEGGPTPTDMMLSLLRMFRNGA